MKLSSLLISCVSRSKIREPFGAEIVFPSCTRFISVFETSGSRVLFSFMSINDDITTSKNVTIFIIKFLSPFYVLTHAI